jgi:alkylation response protein AidB-like acyl-CoA dehydrogenase
MDFALNDEQQMLQEAAQRFLSDAHPCHRARQALPWDEAAQQTLWQTMADMGWNSLLATEEGGGSNLGILEASLIAESAGQHLLNLPWSSSAVLLVLLHREMGSNASAELNEIVKSVMQGQRAVHCITQDEAYWDFAAQCSDFAWLKGLYDDTQPLQIAFIQNSSIARNPSLDPTFMIGKAPDAPSRWSPLQIPGASRARIRSAYRLMQASELVGVAQAALSMSSAYAKERTQFGKLIGSYQAIKHQLTDVWMGIDNARLSVLYAAAALDSDLPDQQLACAVAEFTAIEGALQATRSAVQIHGALGFTWEHDAHLYLKRAQHLAARLGGASAALGKVEAISLH